MAWFDIFRKKSRDKTPGMAARASQDISHMLAEMGTIHLALRKHDDKILEHDRIIAAHADLVSNLEAKVTAAMNLPADSHGLRVSCPQGVVPAQQARLPEPTSGKYDVSHFTEQEKRILAVFFQNKGRRLSYADVGQILDKSAYTVKNQMRQIRQKADLFHQSIGDQSRNLFTLKDDLRIEKFLNVGRPTGPPLPVTQVNQSDQGI